ncbi:MAG: ligT [Dehalococcoidia bacterium]|nr:ligT [Dehalococcoidia bacterium]
MRVFVAIELPQEVREGLAQVQDKLRSQIDEGVRWVDPWGVHLTLKFLGDVAPEKVTPIVQALTDVSNRNASFEVSIEQLGAFPSAVRPRVLWVGIGGDLSELIKLQGMVEDALAPLGFPPEGRGFSPHLTVGRVREGITRGILERIGRALETVAAVPLAMRVRGMSLMVFLGRGILTLTCRRARR